MAMIGLTDINGEPVHLDMEDIMLDDFYAFRDAVEESLAQLEKQAEANTIKDAMERVSKMDDTKAKKNQ